MFFKFNNHGQLPSLVKAIRKCPCEDGVARTAYIAGQPDTYFSVPAIVNVGKVSVTGFVAITTEAGYYFIASKYLKNHHDRRDNPPICRGPTQNYSRRHHARIDGGKIT